MPAGEIDAMSKTRDIDWLALDYAGFAELAKNDSLSKYERIGFPDSYRAGFEANIFADICAKLPRLNERGLTVLDIGPGCSDLPMMLIDLCGARGHRLCLVDSPQMIVRSVVMTAPGVHAGSGSGPWATHPALFVGAGGS